MFEDFRRAWPIGSKLEIPGAFNNLIVQLHELGDQMQTLPPLWCRQLLKEGNAEQLLKLEASQRSKMGADVEQQLRAVKVLSQYDAPEADQPYFVSQKESWADKDVIRQGVLAFLDLVHMSNSEESASLAHALPRLVFAKDDLREKVAGTTVEISKLVKSSKENLKAAWEQIALMVNIAQEGAANEWFKNGRLLEIVKGYNKDHSQLKNSLEGSAHMGVRECTVL